jgi:hypothetical protein
VLLLYVSVVCVCVCARNKSIVCGNGFVCGNGLYGGEVSEADNG